MRYQAALRPGIAQDNPCRVRDEAAAGPWAPTERPRDIGVASGARRNPATEVAERDDTEQIADPAARFDAESARQQAIRQIKKKRDAYGRRPISEDEVRREMERLRH